MDVVALVVVVVVPQKKCKIIIFQFGLEFGLSDQCSCHNIIGVKILNGILIDLISLYSSILSHIHQYQGLMAIIIYLEFQSFNILTFATHTHKKKPAM